MYWSHWCEDGTRVGSFDGETGLEIAGVMKGGTFVEDSRCENPNIDEELEEIGFVKRIKSTKPRSKE